MCWYKQLIIIIYFMYRMLYEVNGVKTQFITTTDLLEWLKVVVVFLTEIVQKSRKCSFPQWPLITSRCWDSLWMVELVLEEKLLLGVVSVHLVSQWVHWMRFSKHCMDGGRSLADQMVTWQLWTNSGPLCGHMTALDQQEAATWSRDRAFGWAVR